MKKILEVKNISKTYQSKNGEIEALKNISFDINQGEYISIIGPSRLWKVDFVVNNSRSRRKNIWRYLY